MAVTGFLHHFGTFTLFVATILLIITCISAPVVHNISMLKVNIGGSNGAVSFGTFGYCLLDSQARDVPNSNGDFCTSSMIGYAPADVLSQAEGTQFSGYAADTTRGLTKVMILHPIAAGVTFIAFMLSLGAGMVGSFLAALVALAAFVITVVVLITDFVLFSILKNNVNDHNAGSQAYYSTAMWTLLAAAILILIGTIVVFFTCCSARLHKRRHGAVKTDPAYVAPTTTRRRRRFF